PALADRQHNRVRAPVASAASNWTLLIGPVDRGARPIGIGVCREINFVQPIGMADSLAAALIGDAPGERYAWEGRGAYNTGGDQSNRREVGRLQIEDYRHSHNVVDAVGLKKRVLSIGSQDKV